MLLRENQVLKNKLAATAPQKRRKVETSPNSTFVRIKHIQKTQIEVGVINNKSEDSEGSEDTINTADYIIVANDDDGD